jgi:hypothetical protein
MTPLEFETPTNVISPTPVNGCFAPATTRLTFEEAV